MKCSEHEWCAGMLLNEGELLCFLASNSTEIGALFHRLDYLGLDTLTPARHLSLGC